jgi:hypothetical protein
MAMRNNFSLSKEGMSHFFRFGWGYILRWLFIGLSFFYLITLIVALHEALSFQHYVENLFVEKSTARRVLVELYQHIDPENMEHVQRPRIPIGAMAIRLDALNNAVNDLRRYQLSGEKPGKEESAPPAEIKDKLAAEFKDKLNEIELDVNNLHNLLSESSDDLKLVDNFIAIERSIDEMKKFKFSGSTAPLPSDDNSTSFRNKAAAYYRDHLKQIAENMESLKNELIDPTSQPLQKQLAGSESILAQLRDLPAKHEELVSQLAASITSLNEQRLDEGQQFNQEMLTDIQVKVKQLAKFNNTIHMDVEKELPPVSSSKDFTDIINGLDNTLVELEKNLGRSERYQEIGLIKQVASTINDMKADVALIDSLSTDGIGVTPENTEDNPETVKLIFKTTLGKLSDAILTLENDFSTQKQAAMLAVVIGADPDAQMKARTILTDFQSLTWADTVLLPFNNFNFVTKDNPLHNLGINTRYMTTLSNESLTLIFVFVIGAIGSLLYITKHYLHMAIQGHSWLDEPSRPLSWYLFRPIFGIVVALAVYLMVRAGQLALGGSDSFGNLNLPIFSVVALFAGLLSWHALDAIESRGKRWFETQNRRNMWATGLAQALRIEDKSIAECASQVGRSLEQVERWLMFRDLVTPEIQDRLATWLNRPVSELFADKPPRKQLDQKPLWATGLKNALQSSEKKLDSQTLAEMLEEEDSRRIQQWINRELQVSPPMQWQLVDVLQIPHNEIFEPGKQKRACWATRLRVVLEVEEKKARHLADAVGIDVKKIHQWMDLDEEVPPGWQPQLETALKRSHRQIFSFRKPRVDLFKYAVHLREKLQEANISGPTLADEIDADLERTYDWLEVDEKKGKVPPKTQASITKFLKKNKISVEDIFSGTRDEQTFAWAVGLEKALTLKQLSADHFAQLIDVDLSRLNAWMAQAKQVAAVSQQRIADQLGLNKEDIFSKTNVNPE